MIKKTILLSLMLLLGYQAFSAYLKDIPQTLEQPDGTILHCLATGDEFYHWLHDSNGYTIMMDPETGFFVYADLRNDTLVPTSLIPGKNNPATAGLMPNLNLPSEKIYALRKTRFQKPQLKTGFKSTNVGNLHNIVVFIRFADQGEFTRTMSSYDGDFNNEGSVSLKQYFREVSDNQLSIETHFFPSGGSTVVSYQDGNDKSYFQPYNASSNPNGYNGDTEARIREHTLLRDALNSVKSSIEGTGVDYDMDNDGYVDNIVFVIRGGTDGWSDLLWPHMWALYTYDVQIGSLSVWSYNFQLDNVMGVSVLCHEMFHSLGAPDLYRYENNDITPVGPWDLMAYNQSPPQHMSAYMKRTYGRWFTSIPEITAAGTYTLAPLSTDPFAAYRIRSPYSSEYFVLEYRKAAGLFETSVPGNGLIVYRINTAVDGNADGPPDEIYVYRPNGTNTSDGSIYSAHFSGSTGRTEINDQTNPSSFLSNGDPGGLNIYDVGTPGETISFTVSFETVSLNPPKNLTGQTGTDFIDLSWDQPDAGDPTLQGYKIYLYGTLIHTINDPSILSYRDNGLDPGHYSYSVTALYTNPEGESEASNTVSLTIAERKPDLVVSNTQLNKVNVDAGSTITISLTAGNEGGINSEATSIGLYLSTQSTFSGNAQEMKELDLNAMEPGESHSFTEEVIIPEDLNTGNYYIIVMADPDNSQEEIDEDNNFQAIALGVRAVYPDLTIQSMTQSTASGLPGALIQINGSWINQGNKSSAPCKLVAAISSDEYLDDTDKGVKLFDSPGLEPQERYNFSGSYQIPSGISPGDYYLVFAIDGLEIIPESNEANNDFSNHLEIIAAEDVEISNLRFEESRIKDGNLLSYSFQILNKGVSDQNSINLIFQLANSHELGNSDLIMEQMLVGKLLADQQLSLQGQLTVPAGTEEGDWFIHVTIDQNSVPEDADPDNNHIFRLFQVYHETDLTLSLMLDQNEYKPGQPLQASITLSNLESKASLSSEVFILWSEDNAPDVDNQLLEMVSNSGLEGKMEATFEFDYIIPEQTSPGNYYLIAIADGQNDIQESDEQNNYALASFKVLDTSSAQWPSDQSSWSLYPNPSAGEFTLQYDGLKGPAYLNIYSITGVKVLNKWLKTDQYGAIQIDLSNFGNGLYLIQLIDQNQLQTKRLVISK